MSGNAAFPVRLGMTPAAFCVSLWLCFAAQGADTVAVRPVRVGVSQSMLGEVNENDARAAMRGWADALMRQSSFDIEWAGIMEGTEQLVQALGKRQVDGLALTTSEYVLVSQLLDPDHVIVDESSVREGQRYLVLVQSDSNFRSLADLRGRNLVTYKNSTTSMAAAWLETSLSAAELGPSDTFFAHSTTNVKLSRGVVLPVFFRQVDACLVTQRAFNAMIELNPQLGRQLRVVATSPVVVPSVMVFRRDMPVAAREAFTKLLLDLHKNPIGQQIQTLFQIRRCVVANNSVLRTSLDMLANYERLKSRREGARK